MGRGFDKYYGFMCSGGMDYDEKTNGVRHTLHTLHTLHSRSRSYTRDGIRNRSTRPCCTCLRMPSRMGRLDFQRVSDTPL